MIHSDTVKGIDVFNTCCAISDTGVLWGSVQHGRSIVFSESVESPLVELISRLSIVAGFDSAQVARAFPSTAGFHTDGLSGFTPSEYSVIQDFARSWYSVIREANRGVPGRTISTCYNRNTGGQLAWVHENVRVFNEMV